MSSLILPVKKVFQLSVTILKILLVFFLFFLSACAQKKHIISYPSLPGYNLTDPVMIQLKTNLDEISGIAYYPIDTSIFAIDDEEGVLYKIYIRKQVKVKQWKFSGDGDYEDIVLHDSTFYVLKSNGDVKAFTFIMKDSLQLQDYAFPLAGNNNFETFYYDSHPHKLIILCKDYELDGKKTNSAYTFDPDNGSFSDSPFYTINTDDIAEELGMDKIKFRPSAAAVHPLTKDVYIISSVNKILVIANHSGKIKDVYELDSKLFKKPEGITFTPAGDLLISNESAGLGAPNILIFKYKPLLHDKG